MGIVTDGLIGYWNAKQGVNGNVWENIAPATKGKYNGVITGVLSTPDGMNFDGVDDIILIQQIANTSPSICVEIYYYHDILSSSSSGGYPFNIYKNTDFRMSSQKHSDAPYQNFGDATNGSYHSLSSAKETIMNLQLHHVVHQYNAITQKKELYVNGGLDTSATLSRNYQNSFDLRIGCNHYNGFSTAHMRGKYAYVRLYSKALSGEEIAQNIAVGKEVGLTEAPKVVAINTEHYKVSKIVGSDVSTLEFSFDADVTEWKVVLLGVSHSTGTLLDSGGLTVSGSKIFSVIYGNKLYQEGQNRINVYGKNEAGWTSYSP